MNLQQKIPDRPFRYDAIGDLGITRYQLRRLVREGVVRVVVRGVYAATTLEDTVEMRVAAVALVSAPGHVVRDRTAAWLHGVDMLLYSEHDAPPPVETCALRGNQPSSRDGVDGRTRDLAPHDIMLLHGLRLTTPLRTALDLGCVLRRRDALAALDAICRRHGITKEQLVIGVARYRRRRGVVQLRDLVGLVDPRAESARESWMRLAMHDAGLPTPEPQYWVVVDGEPKYRIDLAYPKHRIAIEYDGWDAHEKTPDQRKRDRVRRQWLREHGWTVIVVRRGDFTGDALKRWIEEVRAALRPSYTNVRDLERGSRRRRIEQATA